MRNGPNHATDSGFGSAGRNERVLGCTGSKELDALRLWDQYGLADLGYIAATRQGRLWRLCSAPGAKDQEA
ncbi:hypothetical protein D3C72_2017950 [compost metagenome]